jgi:hypothetical protein
MPTRTQQSDLISCAYASHGDTKHVLLFPEDPYECFTLGAQAFDLADRLQTPVFVLLDLDIGMNDRLCHPFDWDDSRRYDRGKVMTAEMLDAGKNFGRYLDVDGDGIPWRTIPGTHPTKGAFFSRGTTRNAYAKYSEAGTDYIYNMERLRHKLETAKTLVPAPVEQTGIDRPPVRRDLLSVRPARRWPRPPPCSKPRRPCRYAARARLPVRRRGDRLHRPARGGVRRRAERKRPVAHAAADRGRNRSEEADPVLHYDGTPITARFIVRQDRRRAFRTQGDPPSQTGGLMTYLAKPKLLRADAPRNAVGYTRRDYEGAISTLCAGCGHDSISAAVVQACFDLDIEPHKVAKLSGIGCSSKTPTISSAPRTASTPPTAACRRC